jgi:hypothetical protein
MILAMPKSSSFTCRQRALARHQQDVLGLEIPVDDAHLMRARERRPHLEREVQHRQRRHGPTRHGREQRVARDVLHDQEDEALVGLAEVGDLHDVVVVHAVHGARLAQEAVALDGVSRARSRRSVFTPPGAR